MNKAAISLGLALALLAAAAQAQTVAAGARAVVGADTVPVYATMSVSGEVRATLKRGDIVTIGLVLFDSDITWCAVSKPGQSKRLGFASCEFLEPDRTPPSTEAPKPAPIAIRPETPVVSAPVKPPPAAPVAAPPAAPEPRAPAPPEDLADTVLDGFGLRSAIANYTRTTRLVSFLDKGRLAEIDVPALERVIAARFQPGAFYLAIGAQLRQSYTADRPPALAGWLQSPAGRKFSDLERRAYAPGSHEELVAFAGSLSKTPPPQPRLLLIHRLYDALRICDIEVETTIALVHTTAQAIGPVLPKEKRYGANELDRALGAVKSRYRSVMKNARLVQYLFAYQSASDAELEQYAVFLESDSGRWLISAIDKGFFQGAESISRRLRDEIPRNVKPRLH